MRSILAIACCLHVSIAISCKFINCNQSNVFVQVELALTNLFYDKHFVFFLLSLPPTYLASGLKYLCCGGGVLPTNAIHL